ncbi:hypothetical protein IX84_19565 [Phaeodactylibacter xiamenensis]|uniref:Uncharacterized protein n=1 Tax=Phaeodactylibacter xiamenensis TaxID=1524460 RepID=A0A098S4C6_9BACT|nr:hypothetical protein IX84_19565 [Phaeodactylibacter xiamenensis]
MWGLATVVGRQPVKIQTRFTGGQRSAKITFFSKMRGEYGLGFGVWIARKEAEGERKGRKEYKRKGSQRRGEVGQRA